MLRDSQTMKRLLAGICECGSETRAETMRHCTLCHVAKPLAEFGFKKKSPDKRCARCADCESLLRRQWVRPTSTWAQEHRAQHLLMKRSSESVRRAITKGLLVRPVVCEQCGRRDRPIEAAHRDYTRPLDVRWLCLRCHRRWDALSPKTAEGLRS